MSRPPPPVSPPENGGDDDAPGVPGFKTWRGVYVFVLVVFIAIVGALTLFSRAYA